MKIVPVLLCRGSGTLNFAHSASSIAEDNELVTFGIDRTSAPTGYCYISAAAALGTLWPGYPVNASVEKLDAATADRFLSEGSDYGNSGMFMLKASAYLKERERQAPEIADASSLSRDLAKQDDGFTCLDAEALQHCPNVSVDCAVMGKADRAAVIGGADLRGNGIGSWSALAEIAQADDGGNALLGDVLADGMPNSYVRADHRMVVAIGLDNVVVVETADAVLLAHRVKMQDVNKIVERLNVSSRHESVTHRRVVRQCGSYESIDQGERFHVKRIVVNLGRQMHHHRTEHWIAVKGTNGGDGNQPDRESVGGCSARCHASSSQSRPQSARTGRSEVGRVSGRGRYCPLRRHLRARQCRLMQV